MSETYTYEAMFYGYDLAADLHAAIDEMMEGFKRLGERRDVVIIPKRIVFRERSDEEIRVFGHASAAWRMEVTAKAI